jgi:succinyl-diaminopimelate desuccinylase
MDPIAFTQALVRLDSVNPPGNEEACARLVADVLEPAGFAVRLHALAPGRSSLVATLGAGGEKRLLAFTGHFDTVPLGLAPWKFDPCGGEISEGRLYGRGSSDMKSGIAAFVTAAVHSASFLRERAGVALVMTAGEETGCDGAQALASAGALPAHVGALIVAEPTANQAVLGHKGALWLRACTHGKAAHGSMPEKGDNAIFKLARAACAIEGYQPAGEHYFFGRSTLNLGTIRGGSNINSVPDWAAMEIDIRSVPGVNHPDLVADIQRHLGGAVSIEHRLDLEPVYTDASDSWVQSLVRAVESKSGPSLARNAATYFTDASVLKPAFGNVPTVILGPGEPSMAHQADEYCFVDRIYEAVSIYETLIRDWMG